MKMPDIEMIKVIAEQLDMGMLCFYDNVNVELMSYTDPLKNIGYYDELFIDDIEKIEENWADYIRLEGMDSTTSFTMMDQRKLLYFQNIK
ncbi:hypothetical protein [Pedobacter ghigonis]|uniref:hypothetical protein n=1 Tax=Pedobacter ghigonis TaxID=2730403 RepID=UPI00158CB875|nr:hypothetical protein [Pedobacter ghigonis]